MTYKEFKAKVEELGFIIKNYTNHIIVAYEDETYLFAVDKENVAIIPEVYCDFDDLSEDMRLKLLGLCYELAKTPLEKRGELR